MSRLSPEHLELSIPGKRRTHSSRSMDSLVRDFAIYPTRSPDVLTASEVIIKAAMGGGGRGMRVVREQSDFKDAFERTLVVDLRRPTAA